MLESDYFNPFSRSVITNVICQLIHTPLTNTVEAKCGRVFTHVTAG